MIEDIDITKNITDYTACFYNLEAKSFQEEHRFYSWKICYDLFQTLFTGDKLTSKQTDFLALNLGMYLASWGMLRGSTDLLQYSYKAHIPVVEFLFEHKYFLNSHRYMDQLKEISAAIFTLDNKIFGIYKGLTGWKQKNSETLVTKILLGVFGICPAYDKYLKEGIRFYYTENNIPNPPISWSEQSLKTLANFYLENTKYFEKANIEGHFPPMKLVDIYFWNLGFKSTEK